MSEFKTLKTAYDEGRTLSSVSSDTIIAVHNPAESTTKTTTIGVVETYIEGNITPAEIGAATSDHIHTGVYEPANSNIQAHVVSAHAPSNAVSLATVKADTDIASAVSLKHSHDNSVALAAVSGTNTGDETKASIESKLTGEISSHTHAGSGGTTDHSALSNLDYASSGHTGFQASETGKGLSTNDLTNTLKTNYDAAYIHSTSSHAPSNAVSLATVKADTDIASAISNDHTHANAAALANVSGTNTGDQDLSGYSLTSHNHTGVYAPVLGADENYVTDAEKTKLSNLSGTNTGDQDLSGYALTTRKLDDFGTPDDNTDLNATTSYHGLCPKLGGGTTNYLRADGTWAAPAGGSSTEVDDTPVDGNTDHAVSSNWAYDHQALTTTAHGGIVASTDSRLTDARTPVSHDNTYHSATYITSTGVTYENLNTNGDIGTGSTQVAAGNHTHSEYDHQWTSIACASTTPGANQITTSTSGDTNVSVGMGIKYTYSGTVYYGYITSYSSTTITFAGVSLSSGSTISNVAVTKLIHVEKFNIPGYYADSTSSSYLLDTDLCIPRVEYNGPAACLCYAKAIHNTASGYSTQPTVTIYNGTNAVCSAAMASATSSFISLGNMSSSYYSFSSGTKIEIGAAANASDTYLNAEGLMVELIFVVK